ncbi:hypothetical protein ACM8B7_002652 [Escherichia coli]
MSHITTEDPATLRLPFKEKLSYGIPSFVKFLPHLLASCQALC